MRVYKFINAKFGHESVQRKRLKISRFDNLNDPFDFNALTFNTIAERTAWQQAVAIFGKDKALMCFSTHFDNPLLWSHYADDHKGIVLGFDLNESVLARPITYTSDFIDARSFLNLSRQGQLAIVEEAVVRKFEQWHYEDEVRALGSGLVLVS